MSAPSRKRTSEWTIGGRMHDHLDPVDRDVEEPVGLDQLEALVRERRRVDRDLRPHAPGRVRERLLRRDALELGPRAAAERAPRGRQDEPDDAVRRSTREALVERRVLAVDRDDRSAPPLPRAHRQLARGDEALLVRERERDAVLERPERRADARKADDGVEHHIGGASLQERRRITAHLDVLDAVLGRERVERRRAGLERAELELGMRGDDVDRLPADRACRTEQGDASHRWERCLSTVFRSCCPSGVTSTPGARRTPPARPRGASRAGRGRPRDRPAGRRSP